MAKTRKKFRGAPRTSSKFSLTTPKGGVLLSMLPGNIIRFGCPVCKVVLYQGQGSPRSQAGVRQITRHLELCKGRKGLTDMLEMYTVARMEHEEIVVILGGIV